MQVRMYITLRVYEQFIKKIMCFFFQREGESDYPVDKVHPQNVLPTLKICHYYIYLYVHNGIALYFADLSFSLLCTGFAWLHVTVFLTPCAAICGM